MTFLTLVSGIVLAGVILFALYTWFHSEPVQLLYSCSPARGPTPSELTTARNMAELSRMEAAFDAQDPAWRSRVIYYPND